MQRNLNTLKPTPVEAPTIRDKVRNAAIGAISMMGAKPFTQPRKQEVATSSPVEVSPEYTPVIASPRQRQEVTATLEENPVLDSPIDEVKIFEYMLARTTLSDALRENWDYADKSTHQENVLRNAFGLLHHFNQETATEPLPAALDDTFLLAHAIDSTRDVSLSDSPLSESWANLRTATRQLLEPQDDENFDVNETLRKAFDRAEYKNNFIIAEYKKVELGQYVVTKVLGDTISGGEKNPSLALYRSLAELHRSNTLQTSHSERRELGGDLSTHLPQNKS